MYNSIASILKSLSLNSALISLILLAGCSSQSEQEASDYSHPLDIVESPIEITWNLISNFEYENQLHASLTFHNTGNNTFTANHWTLYFNSIRPLDPESFLPEFKASHISGDFFKLEPTDSFEPIPASGTFTKEYRASFHAIKKTDAPQGFYFVYDDHIENVVTVTVEPFVGEDQVNRNQADNLDIPTADSRYREKENITVLPEDQIGPITPAPVSLEYSEGSFELSNGVVIKHSEIFSNEAEYLSEILSDNFSIENSTEPLGSNDETGIILREDPSNSNGVETYQIRISDQSIELSAAGNAGIFYAVQSLRSLLSNRNSESLTIQAVNISDYPGFPYRGMHLDVARNFQDKESVLRLLDIMGMYKLNKFHLMKDGGLL